MTHRSILSLLLLLAVSTTGLAAEDGIVDITDKFTGLWNNSERAVHNADGTITYTARQWGGLSYGVYGNWSAYERVVFEFTKATTCDVQPIIGYNGAPDWERNYTRAGVTEAYIDLNPKYSSNVTQVALQTATNATLTIRRIYLVMGVQEPPEYEPEETKPDEAGGRLVINELMQSNIDCLMDALKEFPDSWVELYNAGTGSVNLGNYRLGITPEAADAYQLPGKTIQPGEHAIVFCDKENKELHTHFRLESGKGGGVYLFKDGQPVDLLTDLPKQPAPNIAYGRETDGSDTWGYQLQPTPKAKNAGRVCDKDHLLGDPIFSDEGRVTTGTLSLRLSLTLPEGSPEGTEIRYTLDGSEPTPESTLYTAPLTVTKTSVVRARLFCEGWLSPRSVTQSYIRFSRKLTLPVVSIVTDERYLNDGRIGIFTNNNSDNRNNWRRPINIELFDSDSSQSQLNQLCETRVAGAASRGAQMKSMALYANKRFGTKRFTYEFFPDQKPGLSDFKSIVLRNAGNDFDYLYMRDAICQRTMASHTDLDWQAWRPAIVYINGQYHGMLNIRERANENNVYTNYDRLEDIDLIENWWDLKEGTWDNYNAFKEFYKQKGHTMAEYEEWMDCREFINLMAMNLYYNNYDFPGNNIIMWRPREEGSRWRWIAKDADFTMGLYGDSYNYKILRWLYNPKYDGNHDWGANSESATLLFRQLMEDPDFNREFIDRCAIYMGDFLNERGTWAVWEPMYQQIKFEYPYHRKLINEWWPNYSDEVSSARRWLSLRTAEFYSQLGSYYQLGSPIPLTINTATGGNPLSELVFNGVTLSESRFDGQFFSDRTITLQASATEGQQVSGWRVQQEDSSGSSVMQYEGSTLSLLMPSCSRLNIEPLLASTDGISTTTFDTPAPATVYDLRGRLVRSGTTSLEGLPRGIYIVGGKKVVK